MGLLIVNTDFIGKYKIGGTNFAAMDKYIARYEEKFLKEMLGVELFGLFKAAYIADPTLAATPIYKAIYDPISEDNNDEVMQNNGMKQMILGLVWFEYVHDLVIKMTNAGPVNDMAEVSEMANTSFMYEYYNEAINDMEVIAWYINENDTDYPTYNGSVKQIAHWSL